MKDIFKLELLVFGLRFFPKVMPKRSIGQLVCWEGLHETYFLFDRALTYSYIDFLDRIDRYVFQ